MATKKAAAVATKKVAKTAPAPKKKAPARTVKGAAPAPKKGAPKKKAAKVGSKLACMVCGYAVTVDQACGCAEEHTLICCGTPMKSKKI